jgi:hypothetical protein
VVFCGSANIAGYGSATWTLNVISPPPSSECFKYESTTTFVLPNDGGKLVLDENGLACTPGNSLSAPLHAFGGPIYAKNSTWTVESATGTFSRLAGGAGTDSLHAAGARTFGTYSAT